MATVITGGIGGHGAFTTTEEHRTANLGDTAKGTDATEWMYVQANGAITQYDFVGIDENFQAASLTTAMVGDGWYIGVAQVAFSDNDYGWVATRGSNINGNFLTTVAADVALYSSGTAGSLDDLSSNGTKIDGIVCVTGTTEATNAEVIMTFTKSTTF